MKRNNKNLNEAVNLVPLNSTSYSNLKYDNDNTKNDSVNQALLDDIHAAAKAVGIIATITTAKSGHSEKVKGGKSVSRHMNGTGVDVAVLNGIGAQGASNASNGSPKFRELGNKLKDALVSMGYVWNRESGNAKAVLWQTDIGGNHYNHLHISNNSGVSSGQPSVSGGTDVYYSNRATSGGTQDYETGREILGSMIQGGLGLNKLKDMFTGGVQEDLAKGIQEEINRFKRLIK